MAKKLSSDEKNLTQRYLVWCFKTTKEELDRIDRKFTQLSVDEEIRKDLRRAEGSVPKNLKTSFAENVLKFDEYIDKKRKEALGQKFSDPQGKSLQPAYLYLTIRLQAIESSIRRNLGSSELSRIRAAYETEMTRRIWESREHT